MDFVIIDRQVDRRNGYEYKMQAVDRNLDVCCSGNGKSFGSGFSKRKNRHYGAAKNKKQSSVQQGQISGREKQGRDSCKKVSFYR